MATSYQFAGGSNQKEKTEKISSQKTGSNTLQNPKYSSILCI